MKHRGPDVGGSIFGAASNHDPVRSFARAEFTRYFTRDVLRRILVMPVIVEQLFVLRAMKLRLETNNDVSWELIKKDPGTQFFSLLIIL